MKVKVSEATPKQINWLVAKCEDVLFPRSVPKYTTDWSQGGPIIEREEIAVQCGYCDGELDGWIADSKKLNDDEGMEQYGSTPLIAAMRCYVASKLGEEVEVPDELAS